METKEALKSHNEMQKNDMFKTIERMMADAKTYGEQRKTIKLAILENGFVDENEQEREDYISTNIMKIHVQIETETIY